MPASEEDLRLWLEERWKEKEQQLRQFYKDGHFKDQVKSREDKGMQEPTETVLCLAFCFWTSLICLATWLILLSTIIQVYAVLHASIFIVLSLTGSGAHIIEIQLHQARQKNAKSCKWPLYWISKLFCYLESNFWTLRRERIDTLNLAFRAVIWRAFVCKYIWLPLWSSVAFIAS